MHFLGLHGSYWYRHTAASAYFFLPASEGFRHLLAGIEYGVLGVYSVLTALLDCLIQCLFAIISTISLRNGALIIPDTVLIETLNISSVAVIHQIPFSLPLLLAHFALFYLIVQSVRFPHTRYPLLSKSSEKCAHIYVSMGYDFRKTIS